MLILIKLLPFILIKRKENTGLEENIFNLKVSISKNHTNFLYIQCIIYINLNCIQFKLKLFSFLYKTLDILNFFKKIQTFIKVNISQNLQAS